MASNSLSYYFKRALIKVGFNWGFLFKRASYSQCGEDIIIDKIFSEIGVKPSYLDIGAHHPYYLNNTALLYKKGMRGINIEPDPNLYKRFKRVRTGDINLNIGIGESDQELDFYIISDPVLNTFSKEEVDKYDKAFTIKSVEKIRMLPIKDIISKYCNGVFPDLLTLDVEGLDEQILKSIDFSHSAPTVICVETISFSLVRAGVKNKAIISYLESQGYFLYADTYINSIFVRKDKW